MLASAARTYLNRYGVSGRQGGAVHHQRRRLRRSDRSRRCRCRGDRRRRSLVGRRAPAGGLRARHRGTYSLGRHRHDRRHTSDRRARRVLRGRAQGTRSGIRCDLLLVSGGWNPAVHLYSQARGRLRYDAALGAFLPDGQIAGLHVAGAGGRHLGSSGCVADGTAPPSTPSPQWASQRAARAALSARDPSRRPLVLWAVPDPGDSAEECRQFVDLQRDATVADVLRATGAGLASVEHVKRYTTIGTAHDQGKTSGMIASGIVADALGVDSRRWARPPSGRRTRRSPSPRWPVATAASCSTRPASPRSIPGMSSTAPSSKTSASGNGPGTTRSGGRGHGRRRAPRMPRGPHRCRHHGRLDSRQDRRPGPRRRRVPRPLYTNLMSTLKAGIDPLRRDVRHGRHDHRRRHRHAGVGPEYLLTTTTGNAAKILDWMEEFAADRVAATAGDPHLGHRALGHHPAGRPESERCSPRSRPTSTSPTRPSGS